MSRINGNIVSGIYSLVSSLTVTLNTDGPIHLFSLSHLNWYKESSVQGYYRTLGLVVKEDFVVGAPYKSEKDLERFCLFMNNEDVTPTRLPVMTP